MDGLWLENGPFRLSGSPGSETISINPHSWHRTSSYVVYVDQPVGTGLSFSGTRTWARSDEDINTMFYGWLQNYLSIHNYLLKTPTESVDVYFAGESHAGHYIPSMISHILAQNNAGINGVKVNVIGAAIGNGWFDPPNQYSVTSFALSKGVIGIQEARYLDSVDARCRDKIDKGDYTAGECFALMDNVVAATRGKDGMKINVYDARVRVASTNDFPPGNKAVEAYLGDGNSQRRKALMQQIHASQNEVQGQIYRECNDPAYLALKSHDGEGVVPAIKKCLSGGVRMLWFNGMEDVICNHYGNEVALDGIVWEGQDGFKNSKRYMWTADMDEGVKGYLKGSPGSSMQLLKIKDAGHMVPMDLPEVGIRMMEEFVEGGIKEGWEEKGLRTGEYLKECGFTPGGGGATSGEGGGKDVSTAHVVAISFLAFATLLLVARLTYARIEGGRYRRGSGRGGRGWTRVLSTIKEEDYGGREDTDDDEYYDEEEEEDNIQLMARGGG
ncbi:hypothetical protein TrCOL_g13374 [Triparma columacea]|uniref:Carboxypeptidase n=1 Tax=Triparma columacea TaxID=722753 RepID=A0A9W7L5B1_9STRA|nr:hypothetical protein TrCOL_g13374 [Triparma columacea]